LEGSKKIAHYPAVSQENFAHGIEGIHKNAVSETTAPDTGLLRIFQSRG